jgi:hypothetical protein
MTLSPTLRRRLLLTLALAAALPLGYLVMANLALNTGIARLALERNPERASYSWRFAWTWLPGTVHGRGVALQGRGRRADWGLSADRVTLRFAPGELRHRRFRARSVLAEGVEVSWQRHGALDSEVPGEEVAVAAATPAPESEPRRRRPFETILEGVRLDGVRELRLDGVHWQGEGWARGSLSFDNQGHTQIMALVFDLSEGRLVEEDGDEAGRVAVARFRGELAPWNRRAGERLAWLSGLTGVLVFDASRAALEPVSHFFRGAPVEIRGQGGAHGVLRVERGQLVLGSHLEAFQAVFDLGYLGYWGRGEGRLEGVVNETGNGPVATLDVLLESFQLGAGGGETVHVRGQGLRLAASSPTLDLADPEPHVLARLTLPPSEIPDLGLFAEYLPGGALIAVHGGRGMVNGYLDVDTREAVARGLVQMAASEVDITLQGRRLTGALRAHSRLEQGDLLGRRFAVGGTTVNLDGWKLRDGGSPWQAEVEIPSGELLIGQPLQGRAQVRARLQDSRPFVALLVEERPAARWIEGILTVQGLDLSGELTLAGRELALHGGELRGGRRLELRSELLLQGEAWRGLMLAEHGRLSAAVEVGPGGEREWKLIGSRRWFEERQRVFW